MKTNCSLAEIAGALKAHNRFVVMSHVRPDGDALGCEIAMALCLRQLGKDITVWNEDGMLEKYSFLPQSGLVGKPSAEPVDFDVAIALDTAAQERVGACLRAVGNVKLWINIDHHISNNHYGDLAYIDPTAPATGQILYELICGQGLPFDRDIADNLFVAISTDTGSFQYPNTTARTFEIGGELVKQGVNVGKLSQQMYESYPRRRIDLLRELLNVLKLTCDGRVASFTLTHGNRAKGRRPARGQRGADRLYPRDRGHRGRGLHRRTAGGKSAHQPAFKRPARGRVQSLRAIRRRRPHAGGRGAHHGKPRGSGEKSFGGNLQ